VQFVVVVINEAQASKLVHEKTDTRPCRADHIGKRLLPDLGYDRFGLSLLAKIGHEEKQPG
jgi:hypothetical protein